MMNKDEDNEINDDKEWIYISIKDAFNYSS